MSKRPNLLVIMADQFRWDFLGAAGAEFVRTPNLDRIAATGVRFSQCCTSAPLCAPARIALATGLEPTRMGTLTNDCFLPENLTTYYQRLRDHEYRVGCCGKLDLAKPDRWNSTGDRPRLFSYGFTHPIEIEGKMHAGNFSSPQGPYGMYLAEQGLYEAFHADYKCREAAGWIPDASHDSVLPAEAFQDTYIGRRAAEWISAVGSDFPWHFLVSFAGPHDPFDPPKEYADRYRNAAMPEAIQDDLSGKPAWLKRLNLSLSPEQVAVTRCQYCASIEAIDDAVGQILSALERRGMTDNTYIVFTADHGELLGDHGLYTKHAMYEPALRVPLLAAGPGITGGRTSDALVELIDLNATLCELAGLAPQENIDAVSFAPILRGEQDALRSETVSSLSNCDCIRTERWKLIENHNEMTELYDLATDPQELRNVCGEQKEVARELRHRMRGRLIGEAWSRGRRGHIHGA